MKIEIVHFVKILICAQSYLFALFLFTHSKGKKISNSLLATFLLFMGTQMLSVVLAGALPELSRFNASYGYAYGVLFYFYTLSLIYKDYKFKKQNWLHFIPLVVVTVLPSSGINIHTRVITVVGLYISILTYLVFSHKEITHYHKVVKNTLSNYEKVNLSWLRLALTIFSSTLFIDIIQFLAGKYEAPGWLVEVISQVVFMGLLTFVLAMVYKGLKHPTLFTGISESDVTKEENQVKYVTEELASDDNKTNLRKLQQYMHTEQPHLKPELTLQMLADDLGMNPRYLSQIINYHLGQNFSDFVNTYRVEAAKHRLQNPKDDKETILEVLYEVGFNSKSSFNAIFKKKTGVTPTQFKQQN